MKQTVLFCVPPACGGAERVTLTIAKLLDPDKYDVRIVIVGRNKGDIARFIPARFEVIHIRTRNIWDLTTFRLARLFRNIHPSYVFCSLIHLNLRVILAARIVGDIRIVVRNNIGLNRVRFDNAFLVKKLYPKADAIIMQTDEMKDEFLRAVRCDASKLHVIANPIDAEYIDTKLHACVSPYDAGYVNFVFVGRIAYEKGLDILIGAFEQVHARLPHSRLHLVGKYSPDNPYYRQLAASIKDKGIEDAVVWCGFTDNPYRYIKFADCLVLPSRVEGLPNVLLDAMYLKRPVVAARCIPVIDRLVDNRHGIVVDPEETQALAEAMCEAIKMEVKESYRIPTNTTLADLFA